MTLSSTSRQHRKSMLPTPRLSSRLSSRRITTSETSRIARRVPSQLLAPQASSLTNRSSMPSRVPHPAASRSLPPPEFDIRRACSPSRIPSPSVQPSFLTPEQSETSSSGASTLSAETPYPTPPASVETKPERFNTKVESLARPQSISTRGPPPARHPSRRRESTTLSSFSRAENSTPVDASSVHKKQLAMSSSVSGKENRRPPARTRVLVPPAPAVVVPPRLIQRTSVTHIPSSEIETSPRPLVIKKKPTQGLVTSPAGQGVQAKSTAESRAVAPAGIKVLIGDLDRFAKGWTGMFDELYASTGRHGDVLANASTRMHPIAEAENPRTSKADDLRDQTSNSESVNGTSRSSGGGGQVGEVTAVPLTPSSSADSMSTTHASSTDGETVHFDVSAASLVRWQHRDNTMLKNAPTVADMVPEPGTLISASKPNSVTDTRHSQKEVLGSTPQPITPTRPPRSIPPLPEINQSPILSGPHLVEMTSAVLSNRKDGITKFLEQPPTPTHGTETTKPQRNASSRQCLPGMAPLSSSPSPIAMSLVSVSIPHTSSPLAHQRLHDSPPQRTSHTLSDTAPTRSASLRGLRAIFKRTSAGLTSGQRQRAESLKELIGEPRVLSLGSVSISNLRDVGLMDDAENSGELTPKTAVKR